MQEEQTNLAHLLEILRQRLPELTERYRVKSLGVFGSYLRQEQRPDSDLDLLVTFDEPPSLLTFIYCSCTPGAPLLPVADFHCHI
jgi:predicted nucleotidyltransferase